MKEPSRPSDQPQETDVERKRRLARERQRRHREKVRLQQQQAAAAAAAAATAASVGSAAAHNVAAIHHAARPQAATAAVARRHSVPASMTSFAADPAYPYQNKVAHPATNQINAAAQYASSQPRRDQASGSVVGTMDSVNLVQHNLRAQVKRAAHKKAYSQQLAAGAMPSNSMADRTRAATSLTFPPSTLTQGAAMIQQTTPAQPEQNRHQGQVQQQLQQNQANYPLHAQQFAQNKRVRDGMRASAISVSSQQLLQHQQQQAHGMPVQRALSHSGFDANLSHALNVSQPQMVTQPMRQATRTSIQNVRQQPPYTGVDPLQQSRNIQRQRVRSQQGAQTIASRAPNRSAHRSQAHASLAMHAQGPSTARVFTSAPQQSPQPPPLQPQQGGNRATTEAQRQAQQYLNRVQSDPLSFQRGPMLDNDLNVTTGRTTAEVSRSSRKGDYRYGARYSTNQMSFPQNREFSQRTSNGQAVLTDAQYQERRPTRAAQSAQAHAQLGKDVAAQRNVAQDSTTSLDYAPFNLNSQESTTVAGYLQSQPPDRTAVTASITHAAQSTTQQQVYLQNPSSRHDGSTGVSIKGKTEGLAATGLRGHASAVNGISSSVATETGAETAAQRNPAQYASQLNFNSVFEGPAGVAKPETPENSRSRSASNMLDAVHAVQAGETPEDRKRRLARERQRRRRKRLKTEKAEDETVNQTVADNSGAVVAKAEAAASRATYMPVAVGATTESEHATGAQSTTQVTMPFVSEQLSLQQQVSATVATSKQVSARASYDGHTMAVRQPRVQSQPAASHTQYAVAEAAVRGAPSTGRSSLVMDNVPRNESQEERKRRLARERQRRRRDKLRQRRRVGVAPMGASASGQAAATSVAATQSATRDTAGAESLKTEDVSSAARHDTGGFDNSQAGQVRAAPEGERSVRLSTGMGGGGAASRPTDVNGSLAAGNASYGQSVGLSWRSAFSSMYDATQAVNDAVMAFRAQIASATAEERLYIVTHGIVQLAQSDDVPRDRLKELLMGAL